MLRIMWPDGKMHSATSYAELERMVRTSQWRGFGSRIEFRSELSKRCAAWSGVKVSIWGTSKQFLRRCAGTGLFLLVEDGK